LDLDETLVHFVEKKRRFFTRPYVQEFLENVSKEWEIIVFTASRKMYADWILDSLDPKNYISHRLYRESCRDIEGVHVKDLAKLGRDMSKVVIVDNIPESFVF